MRERSATETLKACSASWKERPTQRAESRYPGPAVGPPKTKEYQGEGPQGPFQRPGPPAPVEGSAAEHRRTCGVPRR
ncbi:hypothetical protein NDU88_007420 [Pleurodeles waltl]|uniref:Uncharacterized protein n=1 Tax=Pleurodeles waltl TaxID=8319 RepID=A0AAV7VTM2_PLEWA|nr:hypothetical protein NDU88_007420 [Pleurodeles waltl]